jgi:hypothetical protein
VTGPSDFINLNEKDISQIWPSVANLSDDVVRNLMVAARIQSIKENSNGYQRSAANSKAAVHMVEYIATEADAHVFASGIGMVRRARAVSMPPVPGELANALRRVQSLPEDVVTFRWHLLTGRQPPQLPEQRATWLQNLDKSKHSVALVMLEEDAIWKEFGQWRKSAAQYGSAVRLWGRAAMVSQCEPWPPAQPALNAFAFFFKNGESFAGYVSHVRSVLCLLRCPLGVLANTTGLLLGARKQTPLECRRMKQRATALQTRRLAVIVTNDLERPDVADSWVVARHFCLRYQAEVVPMEGNGKHSMVELVRETNHKGKEASLTLFHRKLQSQPVVVTRRCICALQGRQLCGVCVLHRRWNAGRIFPEVCYTSSLGFLKAAVAIGGLANPNTWGTHAFRRGRADEALQAGGPGALFYSGGWRGVAAFGYAQAKTRGAIAAAEWLVDFSESEHED